MDIAFCLCILLLKHDDDDDFCVKKKKKITSIIEVCEKRQQKLSDYTFEMTKLKMDPNDEATHRTH